MPRVGLTPAAVVDAALALVDASGADALTLAAVADRVGVRTPSLYKHVDGLADLRDRIARRVTDELAAALEASVGDEPGPDAVRRMMHAYRSWTLAHPARYGLVPVTAPPPGTPLHEASERLVAAAVAALDGEGLTDDAAIHAVRAVRAAVHGFTSIEAAGGFGLPVAVEASFDALVGLVVAGIASLRVDAPA